MERSVSQSLRDSVIGPIVGHRSGSGGPYPREGQVPFVKLDKGDHGQRFLLESKTRRNEVVLVEVTEVFSEDVGVDTLV
jgi:hypothetical protein